MKKMKLNKITTALITGLVGCAITSINAQTTSSQTSNSPTLEVIEITSQKRVQTLQEVPATVTAVSGALLDEYGIDDLFEMADLVPGMVFSRAPDDGLALTLRGLGTPARTQSFDQSVALFQDGMFVGKGRMYSAAFFDVERIEVIKGTQSTLLGKNTSLGAISVISKKPSDVFEGNIKVGREFENGGWSVDGGLDIPLADNFSVRVAGHYIDQNGWVENLATGRDVPEDNDTGLRITALYEPSDSLTITGVYQRSDSERIGNGYQFVDNGNYFSEEVLGIIGEAQLDDTKTAVCSQCPNQESYHDTSVDMYNVTVEKSLEDFTLTSITSYANYDIEFYDDFDFGNAFDEFTYVTTGQVDYYSTYFKRGESYNQFSQELRLASEGRDDFDYMMGLFYFKSDWDSLEEQFFNTPNFPPDNAGQLFNGSFGNDFKQKTDTISAFIQSDMYLTDKLTVSGGLRYTDENKDVQFDRTPGELSTLWNTVVNPPFESELNFQDSFLNGNVSAKYDWSKNTVVYASYGLGSKTGGFAESAEVSSADPSLNVEDGGARVATEETSTYELGSKMVLLDNSMNLNLALFYTDIDDFQETSFFVTGGSAAFLTQNTDVESKGFEIDSKWQITDDVQLSGAVTFADSTHKDDGSDLAQAPKWTGNIGYLYTTELEAWDMHMRSSGFVRYRDSMVSQINETYPSDSLTTLDFTLGLFSNDDTWEVMLVAQNVTNERASDFSGPPAAPIGAILGAPTGDQGITSETLNIQRTVKLQVSYHFY